LFYNNKKKCLKEKAIERLPILYITKRINKEREQEKVKIDK